MTCNQSLTARVAWMRRRDRSRQPHPELGTGGGEGPKTPAGTGHCRALTVRDDRAQEYRRPTADLTKKFVAANSRPVASHLLRRLSTGLYSGVDAPVIKGVPMSRDGLSHQRRTLGWLVRSFTRGLEATFLGWQAPALSWEGLFSALGIVSPNFEA